MDLLKEVLLRELREGFKLKGADNHVLWLFKIPSLMTIKQCWHVVENQAVLPSLPTATFPTPSEGEKESIEVIAL
jgi:hypothetical protein